MRSLPFLLLSFLLLSLSLPVKAAADVHQAAHVARYQRFGAAGLHIGDLVSNHAFNGGMVPNSRGFDDSKKL